MSNASVIRIKPQHYIHVLDNNKNVTRVVSGPQTFTRLEHEQVVAGPNPMILVPPRHYCIIQNPVVKINDDGTAVLKHGDEEVRVAERYSEPFPLYPGESLFGKVSPLQVVAPNTAIRLRAVRDFDAKKAGDEYLFKGMQLLYFLFSLFAFFWSHLLYFTLSYLQDLEPIFLAWKFKCSRLCDRSLSSRMKH
jgi:major vault protein